jgi:DNA replication protein DnaC
MEATTMTDEATIGKMRAMNLASMADDFASQLLDKNFERMSFEERFGLLIDGEWTRRENNRLGRLIKNAKYAIGGACVEDIDYSTREIDRKLIARLSTCNYIHDRRNLVILGPTGGGKTYLANALGMAASRKKLSVQYCKTTDLLAELAVLGGDHKERRRKLDKLAKISLLILDEWLLFPLTDIEARDLFDLIDGRKDNGAVIICSQFEIKGWYDKIGDETVADAIIDRISAKSQMIKLEPKDSMRKLMAKKEAKAGA